MRYLAILVAAAFLLAGCLNDDGSPAATGDEGTGSPQVGGGLLVTVTETYSGDLVTMQAGGQVYYSHDQLGDNHREFWVVNGTKEVRLDLQTTSADLEMRAVGPDCSQETLQKHGFMDPPQCVHSAAATRGAGNLTIEDPAEGPWMVYLFMSKAAGEAVPGTGGGVVVPVKAEDVPYELTVTKTQPPHKSLQVEDYPGELVVAHLGVIRISPDQLGDVYREFWVHDGTTKLELEFEASEDVYLAYGQSFRQRDRFNEQGVDTVDGKANLTFTGEDLKTGGWYFIVFHETSDPPAPNVSEVNYHMTITKHRTEYAVVMAGEPEIREEAGCC